VAAALLVAVGATWVALSYTGAITWFTHHPASPSCTALECAPMLGIGSPTLSLCPAGTAFPVDGCSAGDFAYRLTVESADIPFGEIRCNVTTNTGSAYVATAGQSGFTIENATGAVVAQYSAYGGPMTMTSTWTYRLGSSATTVLTSLYTVLVDVGSANPHDHGYVFHAVGTGAWSGTTSLSLP
jgi:hypothetical protein